MSDQSIIDQMLGCGLEEMDRTFSIIGLRTECGRTFPRPISTPCIFDEAGRPFRHVWRGRSKVLEEFKSPGVRNRDALTRALEVIQSEELDCTVAIQLRTEALPHLEPIRVFDSHDAAFVIPETQRQTEVSGWPVLRRECVIRRGSTDAREEQIVSYVAMVGLFTLESTGIEAEGDAEERLLAAELRALGGLKGILFGLRADLADKGIQLPLQLSATAAEDSPEAMSPPPTAPSPVVSSWLPNIAVESADEPAWTVSRQAASMEGPDVTLIVGEFLVEKWGTAVLATSIRTGEAVWNRNCDDDSVQIAPWGPDAILLLQGKTLEKVALAPGPSQWVRKFKPRSLQWHLEEDCLLVQSADAIERIDPETGRSLWKSTVTGTRSIATSVIAGRFYVYVDRFRVAAIDANTGEERWRVLGPYIPEILHADEERVYLRGVPLDLVGQRGREDQLVALDAATGTAVWRTRGRVEHSVLDQGVLVATSGDEEDLFAVNAATGRRIWLARWKGCEGKLQIHGDKVVVNYGYALSAFDLYSGSLAWEHQFQEADGPRYGELKVVDGRLYVPVEIWGDQGRPGLRAIDLSTGKKSWYFTLKDDEDQVKDRFILGEKDVYITSRFHPAHLYRLNRSTGKAIWNWSNPGPIELLGQAGGRMVMASLKDSDGMEWRISGLGAFSANHALQDADQAVPESLESEPDLDEEDPDDIEITDEILLEYYPRFITFAQAAEAAAEDGMLDANSGDDDGRDADEVRSGDGMMAAYFDLLELGPGWVYDPDTGYLVDRIEVEEDIRQTMKKDRKRP